MTATIPLPVEIDDVSLAFPADALEYMPAWEDIPDEFKKQTPWHEMMSTWMHHGMHETYFGYLPAMIDGERLDGEMIDRQLSAIMGSFAPKHEHKMASLAYLASVWMEAAVYGKPNCKIEDLKHVGDSDAMTITEWVEHVDAGKPTDG